MSPSSARKIIPDTAVASALIERVKNMTQEDIRNLPPGSQTKVLKLRTELGLKELPIEAAQPSFTITPKVENRGRGKKEKEKEKEKKIKKKKKKKKKRREEEDEGDEEEESSDEDYSFVK